VTRAGARCLFLESVVTNPQMIQSNIEDIRTHSPDYANMELEDFLARIENYLAVYQTMEEEHEGDMSFLKVVNAGEHTIVHRHQGTLESRVVSWLMNIHLEPRTIYLTRHGESEYNLLGKIGGDTNLSPRGQEYAAKLAEFINKQNIPDIHIWTSWLQRTIQTAAGIQGPQDRWKALNEIDGGNCEGFTYEEIAAKFPAEFAAREYNKLTYRYPGGESYQDIVARLQPVIMELERQTNVVVVGHQAILRCILAYFLEKPLADLPYIKVPLHTLMKITPVAYGCQVEHINLQVEAVDTHRPRTNTPTYKRLRVSSETARELSDRTAAVLSLGEGDTVVTTMGSPRVNAPGFWADQTCG